MKKKLMYYMIVKNYIAENEMSGGLSNYKYRYYIYNCSTYSEEESHYTVDPYIFN